ncbi:MAG: hypothetical protein OEV79_07990 [candidate division WOR-3 bacterium]|nr:hypothetical protein [candidate division WOR-3 bacterium]
MAINKLHEYDILAEIDADFPIVFMQNYDRQQIEELIKEPHKHDRISLSDRCVFAHEYGHFYQRMSTTYEFISVSLRLGIEEYLRELLALYVKRLRKISLPGKLVIPIEEALDERIYDLNRFPKDLAAEMQKFWYFFMLRLYTRGGLSYDDEARMFHRYKQDYHTPKLLTADGYVTIGASVISENYAMAFEMEYLKQYSKLFPKGEIDIAANRVECVPTYYWCLFDYLSEIGLNPNRNFLAPILFDLSFMIPLDWMKSERFDGYVLNHPGIRLNTIIEYISRKGIKKLPNPHRQYKKFVDTVISDLSWIHPLTTARIFSRFLRSLAKSKRYIHVPVALKLLKLRKREHVLASFPALLRSISNLLPPPMIVNECGEWFYGTGKDIYTQTEVNWMIRHVNLRHHIYNIFFRRQTPYLKCPFIGRIKLIECEKYTSGDCTGLVTVHFLRNHNCLFSQDLRAITGTPVSQIINIDEL